MSNNNIRTHVFPNGFRFIYQKSANTLPITSVQLFCDVGSVHETENIRGASHFIEHMCFKGTKKKHTSKEIFIEYDKIGAYFNAYTSKRYTCYVIKCNSNYLENSIDIVSDMVMNSTFVKKEYAKEHKVVIEENIKNENDPKDAIFEQNDALIYKGSSFEHPVDTLSYHDKDHLKYDDVVAYYQSFYVPERMCISIVSDISFESIKKYLNKTFFLRGHGAPMAPMAPLPSTLIHSVSPQTDIQFRMIPKPGIKNILLTVGFRVCGMNHPDKYKLEFLKHVLTSLMSGRFFIILREKYGLIYSSKIDTEFYDETGDFTIFTQTDHAKLFKNKSTNSAGLLDVLLSILNDLIKNGITEEELKTTKGYLKGGLMIELENIDNQSRYNGLEFLLRKKPAKEIVPLRDIYKTYYADLTLADIHHVICKYFIREGMSVCLLGEQVPKVELVEKEFTEFSGKR